MSEDIKGKIKKIVADHLGIEEEKVTEEASHRRFRRRQFRYSRISNGF